MALFTAVLLISNIASSKILNLWMFTFDGGTILFPLGYIFGDVLTEVYGYTRSRKVIWVGFFCAALMTAVFMIVRYLPPAAGWENQAAFEAILGTTPRIVLASLTAYLIGSFTNSFILAKLKIITKGRLLWVRTISSTMIAEGVDTAVFMAVAFIGVLPFDLIITVFISNYIFKCGVEITATPVTYKVVKFLKRTEGEDYYDYGTNFNPLKMKNDD